MKELKNLTKNIEIGSLIKYRERISTDPPKTGTFVDGWGLIGIVVAIERWSCRSKEDDALKVICPDGCGIFVKMKDVILLA